MFENGMAYVVSSRVKTLQGVALLGLINKKIMLSVVAKDEIERLRNFRLH